MVVKRSRHYQCTAQTPSSAPFDPANHLRTRIGQQQRSDYHPLYLTSIIRHGNLFRDENYINIESACLLYCTNYTPFSSRYNTQETSRGRYEQVCQPFASQDWKRWNTAIFQSLLSQSYPHLHSIVPSQPTICRCPLLNYSTCSMN